MEQKDTEEDLYELDLIEIEEEDEDHKPEAMSGCPKGYCKLD